MQIDINISHLVNWTEFSLINYKNSGWSCGKRGQDYVLEGHTQSFFAS